LTTAFLVREITLHQKSTMKVILLLFFTAFVLTDADAQLNRKAQLGALLDYVTENGISGCKVKKVKTGTSVALKLRENDLITKIGDSLFESKEQFLRHPGDHYPTNSSARP
jgi:hypothetical protein